MPACTFIGNSACGKNVYPCLLAVLEELIITEKVSTFYVGNNGAFDNFVQKALHELSQKYPSIKCYTVLAYLPGKTKEFEFSPLLETLYPEGLEKVPPRFAINHRNRWMLGRSSFLVAYPSLMGSSPKFVEATLRSNKTVINLCDEMKEIFPFRT